MTYSPACLSVSVGQSLCLSVRRMLWQNCQLGLDAVLDGEWGQSRDGYIRWEWRSSKGGTVLGVNVTNAWCRGSSKITLGFLVITRNTFYGTRYLSYCYARFAFNPLFINWVTI